MNVLEIGKFIKELREENNLTQDELAKLIPISRQAISRWEKGKSLPNQEVLLKISEIFNVSIDELLAGKRNPKECISLNLYKERNKFVKITKITLITIVILILILLGYYFFNQYNSFKIYKVSGIADAFEITNGLFIRTNEKIFFKLDNIKIKSDIEYEYAELYYLENNEEKLIVKRNDFDLVIQDSYGYEEYFDYEKLDLIINNMYLRVCNKDTCDKVKLFFREDYKNNNFFRRKKEDASGVENKPLSLSSDNEALIEKIKEKFIQQGENYFYEIKKKDIVETFYYMNDTNSIIFQKMQDNLMLENWIFTLHNPTYFYTNNEIEFKYDNKLECIIGDCQNYKMIINKINEIILDIKSS